MIHMFKFLVCLIIFSVSLFSSPTVYGPTGLIEMPSAESIAYKQLNVAFDYSMNDNSDENSAQQNNFYYKLNLGFLNIGN